ncbi:MAG: ATP-binding protein [Streptosporangiaceae bacterium]
MRNRVTLTGPATMEVSCRQTTLGSRHPGDEIRTTGQALEASIYFFCSEALTNVVKHARASSAWVCVACEDNRCTIEVRDDGIGGAEAQ